MQPGIVDLTELLIRLGTYLYPPDLLSCVQVNRTWHQVFIPVLWRSIDDSTQCWVDLLKKYIPPESSHRWGTTPRTLSPQNKDKDKDKDVNSDSLFAAFAKYGHHIREIRIHWALILEAASQGGACTGLESLVVELRVLEEERTVLDTALSGPLFLDHLNETDLQQEPPTTDTMQSKKAVEETKWINTQHLWHLLRTNPRLARIRIDSFIPFDIFLGVSADFCYATARLLKNLKEFKGKRIVFNNVEFWTLLDLLPSTIESLSIDSQLFPLPIPLPEPRKNMRVLEAKGNTTVNGLLTMFGVFPNLTRLAVDEVHSNPRNPSDPRYCPLPPGPLGGQSLRRLACGGYLNWDELLQHIPAMVEYESNDILNDWMQEYFRRRYPKLESFKAILDPEFIDEKWYPRENFDHTHQLLVTNRHLKEFDSIMNFVKVDQMLRQPWACMGLERLVCRIVGVHRLMKEEEAVVARVMVPGYSTELTEDEMRVVEKFYRCRAQHHGVYDRLASLKRLKHLDLGIENRYPRWADRGEMYRGDDGNVYIRYIDQPTSDTLELTLESGLGRLAALKDLEMFGFECINHRIGKAELTWMAKSWPKLKLMYGLDKDRLFMIEHEKEDKTALRKYFRQLRPDVVHDSLFIDLAYVYNVKDWDP